MAEQRFKLLYFSAGLSSIDESLYEVHQLMEQIGGTKYVILRYQV